MAGGGQLPRDELLQRLVGLVDAVGVEHPVRVAVDGPDAAGKTTLADELADVVRARGREVIRASVDGFHQPRARRHMRGESSPLGYYMDAFDYAALKSNLLEPLGPGGSRLYRPAVFDLRSDTALDPAPSRAADRAVLLCDGVFLLRPELRDLWDLSIFVTAASDVRLRRAMERDVTVFGSVEAVERRYRARYIPGQELYVEQARPDVHADAVVVNDEPATPLLRVN